MLIAGQPVMNRLQVHKGVAEVVPDAITVDAGDEAPAFLIPEMNVRNRFHFGRQIAEIGGGRACRSCSDAGCNCVCGDPFLDLRHGQQRCIKIGRRIHVIAAEGQQVPVIVANADAVSPGPRTIRIHQIAAASVVPGPWHADEFVLIAAEFGAAEFQRVAHPADVAG